MLSNLLRLTLLLLPFAPVWAPVWASPAVLCDQAAQLAAQQTGVPLAVMQALTRAETGRGNGATLEPWPWAVNQAGEGHWFDSAAEAEQFVEAQLEFGYSNLDVGCFQLNHRWHSQGFASLAAMFQPHIVAVATMPPGIRYSAIADREDRRAPGRAEIDACVQPGTS